MIGLIGSGWSALQAHSQSKCQDTAYGKYVRIAGLVGIGTGAVLLVLHLVLSGCYRSSGKLPDFLIGPDQKTNTEVAL